MLGCGLEGADRLLEWLRGKQLDNAPRDTGLWGELGYRIERAVRDRENTISRERLALEQFLSAIEASPNGVLMLDAPLSAGWRAGRYSTVIGPC